MGLDLDSAPPVVPPPYQPSTYTPVVTRKRAQQRLEERREAKGTSPAPAPPSAVTMPMVEVSGARGPILVFRPWSDADVKEAMEYICNPKDNLTKWESDLLQFVREYRPTMSELRRLMNKCLTNEFHKIQKVFTPARMACRLENLDFDSADNADFKNAVTVLIDTVKEKFPLRLNLSAITSMTQGPQESCSSFLARLTTAFDVHSGLTKPDPMSREPLDPYEVHLKEHFLSRMKPELVQMVKKSCVTWKTCPLANILQHAEHAEEELQRREDQKKQNRQKKLEDAQLTMYNACRATPRPYRGRPGGVRGRGRGRGRGRFNNHPDTCHNCGKRGHWQAECPEKPWKGPTFPGSD